MHRSGESHEPLCSNLQVSTAVIFWYIGFLYSTPFHFWLTVFPTHVISPLNTFLLLSMHLNNNIIKDFSYTFSNLKKLIIIHCYHRKSVSNFHYCLSYLMFKLESKHCCPVISLFERVTVYHSNLGIFEIERGCS